MDGNRESSRGDKNRGSELARDSPHPVRGYASLRQGRWSAQHSLYFVTFCTEDRRSSLIDPAILTAFADERLAMDADGTWCLRSSVIMTDHVHLFFELGARLPLSKAIARLKAKLSASLQARGLRWQRGYFEHRLRAVSEIQPTLRYLFLNPVRAGLGAREEAWPAFYCRAEDWAWFAPIASETVVEPGWLADVERVASKLAPTKTQSLPHHP